MECIRSFSFRAVASGDFTTQVNVWGSAPQNYWIVNSVGLSQYNIAGFKNIDIFKIEAIGDINTTLGSTNKAIVQDWNWIVRLNGNQSTIGNNIGGNDYLISNQINNPEIMITKYNPKIEFIQPVTSVTSIEIITLNASGIGAQNIATPSINLSWNIVWMVYYRYEGEDQEFAFL
jgi:hypothetical protein